MKETDDYVLNNLICSSLKLCTQDTEKEEIIRIITREFNSKDIK